MQAKKRAVGTQNLTELTGFSHNNVSSRYRHNAIDSSMEVATIYEH